MKYLIGVGALVVIVVGAVLLFPRPAPTPAPEVIVTAPTVPADEPESATAPAVFTAPEMAAPPSARPVLADQDDWLRALAAKTRENLPTPVTDSLTMTDALFLSQMRIMEYTYETKASDARASARNMRALIEAGTERLCLGGRDMFEMGVALRNSFKDRDDVLFQRVYLLPEDCRQFY
ncbi:hypothetical protein EYC08_05055 [Tabrizicola sp. WMC-M-20]|nr:hypothetical protein EYC08_05055 [Tabrizicola sp. WMC-M-20]